MRFNQFTRVGITFLMLAVIGVPVAGATPKAGSRGHFRMRKSAWKRHGQQQIASDRTREIQEALIREHYLNGQPTGVW
ncbi:MAG TPA: hypothetical protein VIG91_02930, partial [Terriglobales bacterium]